MTDIAPPSAPRRFAALAAGVVLNLAFGSLYVWSLFIVGLEAELQILRTDVSLFFGAAIACFAVGLVVATALIGRLPAAALPLIAALIASLGLAFAARAETYNDFMIGYGGLFGFASGIGYCAALQFARWGFASHTRLASGIAVSAFAIGGMIAAYYVSEPIMSSSIGIQGTFDVLAISVGIIGGLSACLVIGSRLSLPRNRQSWPAKTERSFIGICWLGLFLGAFAGLMAIGHAAAVIMHFGGTFEAAILGVALLCLAIALGHFVSEWLGAQLSTRSVAAISHLLGFVAFMVVLANPTEVGAMISMTLAGLAFGLTFGLYPAAIARHLGHGMYERHGALLLSAIGIAGLTGPWVGGIFFDMTSDYRISLEMAIVACLGGVFNAMRLPRERTDKVIEAENSQA